MAVLREHLYRLAEALTLTQKPLSNDGNVPTVGPVSVKALKIPINSYEFPNNDFDWNNNKTNDSLSNFEDIQTALSETTSKSSGPSRRPADITVNSDGATVELSPATIGTVTTDVYGTVEQPFLVFYPKMLKIQNLDI